MYYNYEKYGEYITMIYAGSPLKREAQPKSIIEQKDKLSILFAIDLFQLLLQSVFIIFKCDSNLVTGYLMALMEK